MPATLLGRRLAPRLKLCRSMYDITLMGVSPGRLESQFLPRLFKYGLIRNLSDLRSATDECESCANLIGNLNESRSATKEGFHYFPPIITSFVRCPRTCRDFMRLIISDPVPPHPIQFNSLLEGILGPGFDQIRNPLSGYNVIVGQFGKQEMIDNLPMVLVLIDVLQHMKRQRVFPEEEIYNCLVEARRQARKVFPIGYLIQAIDIERLIYAEGIKVGAVFPTIKPYTRLGFSCIPYDKWRKLVTKK